MRDDPGEPERGRDRRGRDQERQERRAAREDEQQNHERDRDGEIQLADLQSARENRVDVSPERGVAGDEDPRSNQPAQRPDRVRLSVVGQSCLYESGGIAGGEPLHVRNAPARQRAAPRHGPPHRRACGRGLLPR